MPANSGKGKKSTHTKKISEATSFIDRMMKRETGKQRKYSLPIYKFSKTDM